MASLFSNLTHQITGSETTIRLGVTGLSRAGKTVFITSLIANLLESERMPLFQAAHENRILAVQINEQPSATLPRFEFEKHFSTLLQAEPTWPEGTRNVSEMRISFKIARKGLSSSLFGDERIIHLDIVDYPGEWLSDLAIISKSYDEWSAQILKEFSQNSNHGEAEFLEALNASDHISDEPEREALHQLFIKTIKARSQNGITDLIPGRFLLPGEMEGAPAITFTPSEKSHKKIYSIFSKRFEAYKRKVVRPFFKEHFAKIDRQVILVDVMGALQNGNAAIHSLEQSMAQILSAFRYGQSGFLDMFFGQKIDKIAMIATKADWIHHEQHNNLIKLTEAILEKAKRRALYDGAKISTKAIASLRSTIEDHAEHNGQSLPIVRGKKLPDYQSVGFYFGQIPKDAERFIITERFGLNGDEFQAPPLAPPLLSQREKKGLPHIRLDQLAEFILGDKMR